MKKNEDIKLGDVKVLKKRVGSVVMDFEKGDQVKIVAITDKGYDLMEINSGVIIRECGWPHFK